MDLYSYVPPPGENIPVSVDHFPVDDTVSMEDKIDLAVTRLRNHRSGGCIRYEVQAPERVVSGGKEEGEVGGYGRTGKPYGREDDGRTLQDGG